MAGHVPFVTGIKRGKCVVVTENEERKTGVIDEGILTVDTDQVTVLTSSVEWE